ncbi:MAG: alpha/beta hydrolase, partial [candidate division KSB1 bacterium]|nr:alpha/beta hydrolase [candidate division KSB1 bacterium]
MKLRKLWAIRVIVMLLILAFTSCEVLDPDEPGNLVPKTVDEDPTLPFIEVNGTKLHAETFGNPANPVIIFLHGGPGGDYKSLLRLKDLQDEYFLVFWDQRGSGLSRRHDPDEISIDLYIGDLDAIIDKYRRTSTDKVNLIAHSWGAQIATFYINEAPQRAMQKVNKIVLSDPGPFTGKRFEKMPILDISLSAEWLNDILWNNEFISRDSHERYDYSFMLAAKDVTPKYHFSKTDPSPKWRIGAVANVALINSGKDAKGNYVWDWTTNLSQFTNKVLFIRSGLNEVHTPEYFAEQMADYPNTQLV